jgi:tetratricopeptide (TPR) repeat protein
MQSIEDFLARNEIKKAEIAIAKHLRSELSAADQARILVYRARARLRSARPAEAIDDLLSAREFSQELFEKPETLELLGDAYLARFEMASVGFADRSDTAQASQYFEHIANHFPNYSNRGWVNYQLGRIALTDSSAELAEMYFQRALLTPSHVRALAAYCYERLGFIAFYEKRDLDLALGFFDKAIDTYPASENRAWLVQVYILRSRVLRERKDYRLALSSAEDAINVVTGSGPENRVSLAEALLTAGELLAGFEGRERDTINYLQHFMQISKKPLGVDVTWSRVHEMLADAYFVLSQFDLALESYEAALQYNPYHPWEISLHYRIARCRYQLNDYAGTIAAIQRLLEAAAAEGERIDDYRIYDVLGNAQFALGQYILAEESYRTALALAPNNAEGLEKIRKYHQFAQELS